MPLLRTVTAVAAVLAAALAAGGCSRAIGGSAERGLVQEEQADRWEARRGRIAPLCNPTIHPPLV